MVGADKWVSTKSLYCSDVCPSDRLFCDVRDKLHLQGLTGRGSATHTNMTWGDRRQDPAGQAFLLGHHHTFKDQL